MGSIIDKDKAGVVVVDVQGDFTLLKNGSLAVQETDQHYIDEIFSATGMFKHKGYKIFATQDFHPPNHISFYTSHTDKKPYEVVEIEDRSQVLWPPHCIQGTVNAEILIDKEVCTAVIQKGMNKKYDSYSGFFDDGGFKTGLDDILKSHHLDTLILYGLATDYCVKATALDAVELGYTVWLIEDLCKGVADETTLSALEEMKLKGVNILSTISQII